MRVASRMARTSECCGPSLSMLACVVIVKPSSLPIHMAGAPTSTILSGDGRRHRRPSPMEKSPER